MGLDWHSATRSTREEKKEYVLKYYAEEVAQGRDMNELIEEFAPTQMKPCSIVGAKRMHELKNGVEILTDQFKQRQEELREIKKEPSYNEAFVEYWESMTLDQYIEQEKDKWSCDTCPFLKALQGADSTDNMFLGMTVSSCDFRGKRISSNQLIDFDLKEEAFEEHAREELLEYADRLENDLERLKDHGLVDKDPYEMYLKEHENDPWLRMTGQEPMTEAEYEESKHWTEESVLEAIHWLRTLEKYGVDMTTSY